MVAEKKKRMVPQLRFSEFDGEWRIQNFGDLVKSISSGKIKPNDEGEYLVYGSTGVIGRSNQFSHEGDYILIARVGANAGRINRVSGKYGVTDNTLVIDSKKSILDNSFTEGFLEKYNLNKLIFGSGQPLITGGLLKSIKINLPSLPEQQKIASFLTAVDKKLQQLTTKKQQLEDYKKGVMQQLFSQQLRFKDDTSTTLSAGDGNDFPDWEEKRFEEIFSFYSTNSFSRDNLNYEAGTVKNIHYGDIHTKFSMLFRLENEKVPFINSEIILDKVKHENYCREGDLVIADASEDYDDIGKSIEILNLNDELVLAGLHTFLARPNKFNMFKGFSGYMMQSSKARKQIKTIAQGTKVLGLATTRLGKIKLLIPSLKEQQKIAAYLSALDHKIETVAGQLAKTQEFKKGLLQQMFV